MSNLSEEEIINVITKMLEKNDDIFEETGNHLYFSKMTSEVIQGLLDFYNKEKERRMELELQNIGLKEERRIAIEEIQEQYYISKDKLKEILGIEEDVSNEAILSLIATIVDENNRLEDIEDRKVQVEYNNVFNKGVESVEDKIKEIVDLYNNTLQCTREYNNELANILCDLEELLKGE